MKIGLKIGDTVEVIKGKLAGQKSKVVKIDKKNERVILEGLKKTKTKKKELHGSLHLNSVKLYKVEKTKVEEKKEEATKNA